MYHLAAGEGEVKIIFRRRQEGKEIRRVKEDLETAIKGMKGLSFQSEPPCWWSVARACQFIPCLLCYSLSHSGVTQGVAGTDQAP